jgi:ribonuclease BN (tRNA processing enzyme)
VQDGAANVLLDAGHGAFSRMGHFFDFKTIRAVVLTHLHPDHYADLPCLRHAIAGALREGTRQQGKLPLYLPSRPEAVAKELAGYTDAFEVTFIEDLPRENVPPGVEAGVFEVGPVRFFLLPVRHSLPAYAVGVEGSGYFVYSGDSSPTTELELFSRKADIFLCEASGLDKDEEYLRDSHMTARQAGELAKRAGVKELIITHFYPEYDLEELRAQARAGYGNNVELAVEGDTYFVY